MDTKSYPNGVPLHTFGTTLVEPPQAAQRAKAPTRWRLRLHPLLRDLSLTMATEFAIMAAGLVLVSLFGRLLGPVALGEYLLLRRITAWLLAGVLLGMASGLPRYVAHAVSRPERERRAYFLAGTTCLMVFTVGIGLVMYLKRQFFARWLFGNPQLDYLILPLCLLLAGLAAQTAAYGYYRGTLAMKRANAIQLFHFAVIPVVAVLLLYPTQSVALIVGVTGAATVVAAVLFALPVLRELASHPLPDVRPYVAELLRYGLGRVPGDFGRAALFALGPIVAAHYVSMKLVSYLLLGCSFLMVLGYAAGPLGVVLLSKFSMLLGQNRFQDMRAGLEYLVGATLDLSVFASLQFVVFADVLVRLWVGARYLEGMPVVRLLLFAVPPYLFYIALRSSIDAAEVKPLNTGNVLVALSLYLILQVAAVKLLPRAWFLEGIAASLVLALVVLGVLTARTYRKLFKQQIPWSQCAPSLGVAVALGAGSFAFRWAFGFHEPLVAATLFELLVSGLFLAALVGLGSPWLRFIWRMAHRGRAQAWPVSGQQAV